MGDLLNVFVDRRIRWPGADLGCGAGRTGRCQLKCVLRFSLMVEEQRYGGFVDRVGLEGCVKFACVARVPL